MPSYDFVIDERARAGAAFLTRVRDELQRALLCEKAERHVTQQSIADKLGVNRSVVNRQFMGLENLTARTIGELFWALGWEPCFEATKIEISDGENECVRAQTASSNITTPAIAVSASGQAIAYQIIAGTVHNQLAQPLMPQ